MSYGEFWRRYLRAHDRPATRALHYCGSMLALSCMAAAIVTLDWRWLIGAPLLGYGFAWAAHFAVEGNRPETFGHPLWSLGSDFRMLGLFLSGRLSGHLARAAVTPPYPEL